jgi:hypothetical protein
MLEAEGGMVKVSLDCIVHENSCRSHGNSTRDKDDS